ncbi:MAG: M48 family metalloprotease [Actinomycetota bacterium]
MNKNVIKTFVFMAALGGFFVLIGAWVGDRFLGSAGGGMAIFLAISVLMNMASYWWSDKLVIKMTRSRPVSEQDAPWLYRIVRELTQKNHMPMPKLYIMPAAQPNAFATGRNPEHAAVAVTEGILNVLDERELEGVLAHEISHVANRDILIGAVAASVATAVMLLARMAFFGAIFGGGGGRDDRDGGGLASLLLIFLAPVAALMIQMAVSRSRESEADRSGATLLGDATPLANALIKIDAAAKQTPAPQISPAVSHVFLQNPLRGKNFNKLFMSHPPLEERIEQLRELGAKV